MKTGTVKMIYMDKIIRQLNYKSVKHRKEIVENWKKFTGIDFGKCEVAIQVRPNV